MDFELLFYSPLYITKSALRRFVCKHAADFHTSVLDVGCGSQRYRKLLPSETNYIGLEFNLGLHPHICGSALYLPFKSEAFESVLSIEVLEHLPEPERALTEIARILKPEGKLILTTPMTWYLHYEPSDYYRFTNYGLTYLLNKAGFRVLKIERTGGLSAIILLYLVEKVFRLSYAMTSPLRWLSGTDRGRWRTALILTIPINLVAIALNNLIDTKRGTYVQGWMVLAEKAIFPESENDTISD